MRRQEGWPLGEVDDSKDLMASTVAAVPPLARVDAAQTPRGGLQRADEAEDAQPRIHLLPEERRGGLDVEVHKAIEYKR